MHLLSFKKKCKRKNKGLRWACLRLMIRLKKTFRIIQYQCITPYEFNICQLFFKKKKSIPRVISSFSQFHILPPITVRFRSNGSTLVFDSLQYLLTFVLFFSSMPTDIITLISSFVSSSYFILFFYGAIYCALIPFLWSYHLCVLVLWFQKLWIITDKMITYSDMIIEDAKSIQYFKYYAMWLWYNKLYFCCYINQFYPSLSKVNNT